MSDWTVALLLNVAGGILAMAIWHALVTKRRSTAAIVRRAVIVSACQGVIYVLFLAAVILYLAHPLLWGGLLLLSGILTSSTAGGSTFEKIERQLKAPVSPYFFFRGSAKAQ